MNNTNDYYMIKIENPIDNHKSWVGWSNSNYTDGFYLTSEKQCKIFSTEILEEDEKIKMFLKNKKYNLVQVIDIEFLKESRLYF